MEELDLKDSLKEHETTLQSLKTRLEKLGLEMGRLSESKEKEAGGLVGAGVDLPVEIETATAQAQFYKESTTEFKKLLSASGIKKVSL